VTAVPQRVLDLLCGLVSPPFHEIQGLIVPERSSTTHKSVEEAFVEVFLSFFGSSVEPQEAAFHDGLALWSLPRWDWFGHHPGRSVAGTALGSWFLKAALGCLRD